jgi:hypothetical protein
VSVNLGKYGADLAIGRVASTVAIRAISWFFNFEPLSRRFLRCLGRFRSYFGQILVLRTLVFGRETAKCVALRRFVTVFAFSAIFSGSFGHERTQRAQRTGGEHVLPFFAFSVFSCGHSSQCSVFSVQYSVASYHPRGGHNPHRCQSGSLRTGSGCVVIKCYAITPYARWKHVNALLLGVR